METQYELLAPPWIVDPIYRALVAFPIAAFTLTAVTDYTYMRTSNLLWLHFSEWLLLAGLVFGVIAALYLAVRLLVARVRPPGIYVLGGIAVLLLATLNSFFHTIDGWTAVVPYGIATSLVTVLVMVATALLGRRGARYV